ncbi:MAG: hypothetical protein LBQ60_19740 [Bacteroidales bacterium]|nr:hypothetical protein [Bacteroidales bacterium]
MLQTLFDIKMGYHPESTIKDVCDRYNVNTDLFLFICNIYSFDNYPHEDFPSTIPIKDALTYLLRSHEYSKKEIYPYVNVEYKSIEHLLPLSFKQKLKGLLDDFFENMEEYYANFVLAADNYLNTGKILTKDESQLLIEQMERNLVLIDIIIETISNHKVASKDVEQYNHLKYYLTFLKKDFPKHTNITKHTLKPILSYT